MAGVGVRKGIKSSLDLARQKVRVQALVEQIGVNARATLPDQAVLDAEIVVLATQHTVVKQVCKQLGDLGGKIIIDPNNPLNEDGSGLTVGLTTSAGEEIASWFPNAFVVKAFNITSATYNMADPIYSDQRLSMFICGDDADAKAIVATLAEALNFVAVDCGPLTSARYLEPMAMLWITLARDMKLGGNIGFCLLTR
ncbi:MAG: NAD(P)-binding domain-containing protein [Caldilineaceae bacterium]